MSGDSKEIIIRDDDEDEGAVKKKAADMGVEVGSYGEHEVKAPEPEPQEDIIADEIEPELTDEEIDAQLKNLGDLENLSQEDLLDKLDANAPTEEDENFSDDFKDITRFNRED